METSIKVVCHPMMQEAVAGRVLVSTVTVEQAVVKCLKAKEAAGYRPTYVKSLSQSLRVFASEFGERSVCALGADDIEDWLNAKKDKPSTRAGRMARLASLFAFCHRRGWVPSNPVESLERVRLTQPVPQILSPDQAQQIMEFTKIEMPRCLAWLTICLFSGLRPEEPTAYPLKPNGVRWDNIDLVNGTIRIEASVTKTTRRRIVHLTANAIEWLSEAKEAGSQLPLRLMTKKRLLIRLREHLGLPVWPKDVLRHTAASMMLAINPNAAQVAMELGNSPKILMTHYHELVSREDATKFWKIKPKRAEQLLLDIR